MGKQVKQLDRHLTAFYIKIRDSLYSQVNFNYRIAEGTYPTLDKMNVLHIQEMSNIHMCMVKELSKGTK
jgi:hypothetical protein